MTRGTWTLLLSVVVGGLAFGQDRDFPGWDRIPTRDRLLAERAAQIRGMRDLSREILNLRIGGGTLADLVGNDAEVSGKIIQGADTGETRLTDDGFARVTILLPTARLYENLGAIDPSVPRKLSYADLRAAVGGERMMVEGLGRPRGFPEDLSKHYVPPAPAPRQEAPKKHGALEPGEDERFAERPLEDQGLFDGRRPKDDQFAEEQPRSTEKGDWFAERQPPAQPREEWTQPREPQPRERALEDDQPDSGWKVVQDSGWVTVSETEVKSWDAGGADCDQGDGRWEVIEERVLSRKVISEEFVVR